MKEQCDEGESAKEDEDEDEDEKKRREARFLATPGDIPFQGSIAAKAAMGKAGEALLNDDERSLRLGQG
jgi:hypothetical protein